MALALRVVAVVCTFVGFGFVSLGDALTQVGAMCRDASTAPHGTPAKDSTVLQDTKQDGAPVWYYDVKPAVASRTSTYIREGRKWYVVQKGREVGIFDTWETCKSHVDRYKGSEFKSFQKLSDAHTYLQWKN